VKFFLISEYLAKLEGRRWLSCALNVPGHCTVKSGRKCMAQFIFLMVNMLDINVIFSRFRPVFQSDNAGI